MSTRGIPIEVEYDMATGVGFTETATHPTAASMTLLPPSPMNQDGNPATEWKRWRQKFEIYLTASRQVKADDEIKISLLLHSIGSEGLEVYNTFTFTEDEKKSRYSAVLTKFQSHYVPKLNVTYERHNFFSRNRQPGESIDRYVKDLRIVSKLDL